MEIWDMHVYVYIYMICNQHYDIWFMVIHPMFEFLPWVKSLVH